MDDQHSEYLLFFQVEVVSQTPLLFQGDHCFPSGLNEISFKILRQSIPRQPVRL